MAQDVSINRGPSPAERASPPAKRDERAWRGLCRRGETKRAGCAAGLATGTIDEHVFSPSARTDGVRWCVALTRNPPKLALLVEIRTEPARRECHGRNGRRGIILDVFDRGVRRRAGHVAAMATGEFQSVVLGPPARAGRAGWLPVPKSLDGTLAAQPEGENQQDKGQPGRARRSLAQVAVAPFVAQPRRVACVG